MQVALRKFALCKRLCATDSVKLVLRKLVCASDSMQVAVQVGPRAPHGSTEEPFAMLSGKYTGLLCTAIHSKPQCNWKRLAKKRRIDNSAAPLARLGELDTLKKHLLLGFA